MRYIPTFIKTICLSVLICLFAGCTRKGIIKKQTMSAILMDMYLADQYIEQTPDMRAQTDTLAVYPAIIEKYGYTVEEYANSVRYWLQEDREYTAILESAQAKLEERVAVLDEQLAEIERLRRGPVSWWALDSARSVLPQEFLYDRLLRGVRWLVVPSEELPGWKMLDSAVVDIPQNPVWWSNNMEAWEREFSSFFIRGGAEAAQDVENGKDSLKTPEQMKTELKPYTKTDLLKMEDLGEEEEERIQNAS